MIYRHHYITRNPSIRDFFHTEWSHFNFPGYSSQSSVLIRGGNSVIRCLVGVSIVASPSCRACCHKAWQMQVHSLTGVSFFLSLSSDLVLHTTRTTIVAFVTGSQVKGSHVRVVQDLVLLWPQWQQQLLEESCSVVKVVVVVVVLEDVVVVMVAVVVMLSWWWWWRWWWWRW